MRLVLSQMGGVPVLDLLILWGGPAWLRVLRKRALL